MGVVAEVVMPVVETVVVMPVVAKAFMAEVGALAADSTAEVEAVDFMRVRASMPAAASPVEDGTAARRAASVTRVVSAAYPVVLDI
jgi:hypothetical protein